jgi:hypothetical protein
MTITDMIDICMALDPDYEQEQALNVVIDGLRREVQP